MSLMFCVNNSIGDDLMWCYVYLFYTNIMMFLFVCIKTNEVNKTRKLKCFW